MIQGHTGSKRSKVEEATLSLTYDILPKEIATHRNSNE